MTAYLIATLRLIAAHCDLATFTSVQRIVEHFNSLWLIPAYFKSAKHGDTCDIVFHRDTFEAYLHISTHCDLVRGA